MGLLSTVMSLIGPMNGVLEMNTTSPHRPEVWSFWSKI